VGVVVVIVANPLAEGAAAANFCRDLIGTDFLNPYLAACPLSINPSP
jgi:hypothetical protein